MVFQLKSYEFRRERERTWRELERLVDKVEKSGLGALEAAQLARLPVLYRATLSSLSVARSISLDRNLLDYLDGLAARAYFCLYGTRVGVGSTVRDFFARRFPQAVRRFWIPIAMAGVILALGVTTAWVMTARNQDWFYVFVSDNYAQGRTPTTPTEELESGLYDDETFSGRLGQFASFLFSNNARVGLVAFALGFLAGIPVYLLLFTNGLVLGAFAALFASRGLGWDFWGWILPHGVTELTAIAMSGGMGLVLAHALVFPGRATRLQNLARRGRAAGVVMLGAIAMFLVAGLIEGFFRQMVQDVNVRFLVAVGTMICFGAYFALAGRSAR
ncbi:MAG: stage II sporulation protein M [Planctomycetota bacterium]|nr:stage II sporulation protein M [Planctomycetota bacterium]